MVWLKWNELKFLESFKQKVSKYCSTHFNIKVCRTHKHTDLRLVSGILFIYQGVIIGYVNLRGKWNCVSCRYFGNVETI